MSELYCVYCGIKLGIGCVQPDELCCTKCKIIQKLESENKQLKAERDEARRQECLHIVLAEKKNIFVETINGTEWIEDAKKIAQKRGWNCFKQPKE